MYSSSLSIVPLHNCSIVPPSGPKCNSCQMMDSICSRGQGSYLTWNSRTSFPKFSELNEVWVGNHAQRRMSFKLCCARVSLEEDVLAIQAKGLPKDEESDSQSSTEEVGERPLSIGELKILLADSQRSRLTKKLSEANQLNRFLKRKLQEKEEAFNEFRTDLAVIELEIQALVGIAEEITKAGIPGGSRKINGKYIQSHLLTRLKAIQEKLKEQIKDVNAEQSKDVPLSWSGMAESVQVMGSFDGWTQGEHLSPEYTGSYTRFSTTLMLPPGRYEIKFLIDGEWHISPQLPTVGEGLMMNNLLVVE
ncbi:hypothetical protein LIER_22997 [Lithospermum erythrorhizon]|uniref:AMP-activated protein kinase glycogen-binding domain-containing protein n=1 Tax=Lithospermum erythrorhizon TaxID=34254 RepID=A0AAV3QW20_LITER